MSCYHGRSAKILDSRKVILMLQVRFCHNWWHCSLQETSAAGSRGSVAALCARTFLRRILWHWLKSCPVETAGGQYSPESHCLGCSGFLLPFVCLLLFVVHCFVVTRGTSTPNCLATILFSSYKHCMKDNSQYLPLRFKTCQYCSLYHSHCNYFQ